MTWNEWINKYSSKIDQNEYGYERMFVEKVFKYTFRIRPDDVIPQYRFIDRRGRSRYIDFVIKLTDTDLLPIELDGAEKFSKYDILPDTLERQNELLNQFGRLLRFSNNQLLHDPDAVKDDLENYVMKAREEIALKAVKSININIKESLTKLYQVSPLGRIGAFFNTVAQASSDLLEEAKKDRETKIKEKETKKDEYEFQIEEIYEALKNLPENLLK
jgi:hypothetical protein